MKKVFLRKLSEMHLEDLNAKQNISHRISHRILQGGRVMSAEEKTFHYFSTVTKYFQIWGKRKKENGLKENIGLTRSTKTESCVHL